MYIKRMLFEVKSGQEEKAESVQSKWIIQISTYSIQSHRKGWVSHLRKHQIKYQLYKAHEVTWNKTRYGDWRK